MDFFFSFSKMEVFYVEISLPFQSSPKTVSALQLQNQKK